MRAFSLLLLACRVAAADTTIAEQGVGVSIADGGRIRWLMSSGGVDASGLGISARGGAIGAYAASPFHDGAHWLATDGTVAFQTDGIWTEFALPSARPPDSLTPIDDQRALIVRGNELVLATKDQRTDVVATGHGRLGHVAADGHGGAWILLADRVAHWTDAGWSEQTAFVPTAIVRTPDGYLGATDREIDAVVDDRVVWRVPIADGHLLALAVDRTTAIAIAGDDSDLTVLRVRIGASDVHRESVDVPRWWRKQHRPRDVDAAALVYDGGLWIVTHDLAWRGENGNWHTYGLAATPADEREDVNAPRHGLLSIALQDGYAIRPGSDGGFAFGVRPELIYAPTVLRACTGIGGYVELERAAGSPHESWLGGGVTVVRYGRDSYQSSWPTAVALSAGGVAPFAGGHRVQPEMSLFVGLRSHKPGAHSDGPVGLRFDARVDVHGLPSTYTVSLTTDVLYGVGTLAALASVK